MFERKMLGLLQPNLQGKLSYQGGKLVLESPTSCKRKNDENQTPLKPARKDGIYEDPVTPLTKRAKHCLASGVDAAVQTEQRALTPLVNCHQAATSSEKHTTLASTSCQNDVSSGSNAVGAAPIVEEQSAVAATPCQEGKPLTKSGGFETPIGKGLPSTSKAMESGVKERAEARQSSSSICFSEKMISAQAEINMLTTDLPNEKYWEMVAAERKAALSSALTENKQLYVRNTELQDRVHFLEQENTLLENWLQESKRMAELLSSVTKEQDTLEEDEQQSAPADESADEKVLEEEEKPLAEPIPAK